jgi:hypothetical protein
VTRGPKPAVADGDLLRLRRFAWLEDPRRWADTGESFECLATSGARWDEWRGKWCVDLAPNPYHGRVAVEQIAIIRAAAGWSEPDLFEAAA